MNDEWDLVWRLRRTPRIFERLEAATGSELHLQDRLRREFPDDLVRAALSLAELRRKAAGKFSRAESMWFDRRGLQQSTPEAVARHKARRFEGAVCDFCMGIGSDAIALAERCEVLGFDVSPAQCLRARWNAEAYRVDSRLNIACADVETLAWPEPTDHPAIGARRCPPSVGARLVHVDPDRRHGRRGSRSRRVEDALPGLPALRRIMRAFDGGAVKLSPAANFVNKFTDVEIELVSLSGEAREATIWFGSAATPGLWRATVLPAGETLAGDPLAFQAEVTPLGRYVYDPDPAVVRAALVDLLAEQTGLNRLDEAEEYLTSDRLVESPFVQAFEVLAELPNNQREIRRYFRGGGFGQVEIKCRRVPARADAVRRKLPLQGDRPAVLIFARLMGKARALVCRRLSSSAAS